MNDLPSGIEKEVCEDIASRQRYGLGKYPTTVEENPSPLVDWLTILHRLITTAIAARQEEK